MPDGASVAVVIGGFVGVTVTACATVALTIEVAARLRTTAAPPGTHAHRGVPMAAAVVVITLGVGAAMAHGGPGRAHVRASSAVISASGRTVSSKNAADRDGATTTTAAAAEGRTRPSVGEANTLSATPERLTATWPAVLPDASRPPVLVVFDVSTITLAGAVPSDAARQRLSTLAAAYSKTAGASVVNHLTIDPRVPDSTGVRVIEMQAVRFATGSGQVTPDYAPGLGRVVAVMKSLPNLIALVVGHADQRGDSQYNLRLSLARATAVVDYLITQGIGSDRLSAQGVGDRSPLTLQSDAAGLALNRRTEFVFFGLLAGV